MLTVVVVVGVVVAVAVGADGIAEVNDDDGAVG